MRHMQPLPLFFRFRVQACAVIQHFSIVYHLYCRNASPQMSSGHRSLGSPVCLPIHPIFTGKPKHPANLPTEQIATALFGFNPLNSMLLFHAFCTSLAPFNSIKSFSPDPLRSGEKDDDILSFRDTPVRHNNCPAGGLAFISRKRQDSTRS